MQWTRRQIELPRPTKARPKRLVVRFLLILALIAWLLRIFVAPPSASVGLDAANIYVAAYLFVAKWPYGYSRYSFPFGFPTSTGGSCPICRNAAMSRCSGLKAGRLTSSTRDRAAWRIWSSFRAAGASTPRRAARGPAAVRDADQRQQRVQSGAAATPFTEWSRDSRIASTRVPRDPPDGSSYTVLDQVENPRVDVSRPYRFPAMCS